MELSSGDLEGSSDDPTGKKKSKLKTLKTRLFGKTKTKEDKGERKLSQSDSDITQGKDEELDVEENFSNMGSRALSHDSIFLADLCLSSTEPPRVLSQENVQSRIKTLQMKLQQQNLRLGHPPLVMSIKRPEDASGSSEDDGLPQSPPEIVLNGVLPQRASYKTGSPTAPIVSAPSDTGVDFSSPAQFTPCLDNSAARHRMSVKPRNQRASAKIRKLTSPASRARSESMNNLGHPMPNKEDEKGLVLSKESIRFRSHSSQVLRTGRRPATPPDENHLPNSTQRSLMATNGPHQPASPLRPPIQPRPLMTENVVGMSTLRSQLPAVPEPPMDSVPTSGTEATPVMSPAADPKKNHMASETVGTKAPGSPKTKSVGSTRQVGENLGIFPLKPAQSSAPSTAVPQRVPASVLANKRENDKQCVTGSQMPVLQNKTETADRKGNQSLNPQTEIPLKAQPVMADVTLRSEVTPLRSISTNEKTPIKEELKSGMLTQPAKVSAPIQIVKPQAIENIVPSQQRPTSGSPRFTISSAHNKDRTRTGSFTSMFEETGAKKDLTKPTVPYLTHRCQEQRGVQKGDMKAKELPPTAPAETPMQRGNSSGADQGESSALQHETGEEATEEEGQDGVEEAEEAHEDLREHGEEEPTTEEREKNAFGVKLRSTSLSLKYKIDTAQSEVGIKRHSADVSTLSTAQGAQAVALDLAMKKDAPPAVSRANRTGSLIKSAASPGCDSLTATPAGQNISSFRSAGNADSRLRSRSLRQDGEANQSAVSASSSFSKESPAPTPSKQVSSAPTPSKQVSSAPTPSKQVSSAPAPSKQVSSAPLPSKEASPSQSDDVLPTPPPVKEPEAASSDSSWIGMAMEKTRTIQQLLTSKLPEFPEGPTLPVAPPAKKEFIPSPTVEAAPVPSPSIKRKAASSPTKQTASVPLPSKEVPPPQSDDVKSTAQSVKESETASSEVSWMSMAMEKTRTFQQLFNSKPSEFPGPQTDMKPTPTTETQPAVLQPAVRPAQSTISEKPSGQPTRKPKQTALPDASPTESSQSPTAVLHSIQVQPITKQLPVAASNPKPIPPTASQSPATQTIIRGTQLRASQSIATQPNISTKQLVKQAQSQQATAQSTPPSSIINKTQPSPPPSSTQSIPHPSQSTDTSHLSSSPKPPSHLKQQSQPAPPSIPQGNNDGLNSVKKRGDLPQPASGRGSGANTAEAWEPRTTPSGSKAAFLEKWGDKGASAGTKIESSKTTSEAQSSPQSLTSVRTGHLNRDSKTDTDLVPSSVPSRPTDREDRSLKRSLASASSPQQPISEGGQPSWMEVAKRKSLAWSDKSTTD
ncbi:proteoglycan 4 isoform X2 [Clupea harengus]|uniref:Proteoglycan 4 isoform X2 n=1 Tax=Clupea harengus TaxID=7950 RepID=A0A6P8GWV4_CLUHA|nr:proteoglycan 4 isoform X2 [Clupea harengus]